MRFRMVVAAALIVTAFAGCRTDTQVTRVNASQYVVEDDNGGSNPEKGIPKACRGRYVAGWKKIPYSSDGAIIVTCGPPLPRP